MIIELTPFPSTTPPLALLVDPSSTNDSASSQGAAEIIGTIKPGHTYTISGFGMRLPMLYPIITKVVRDLPPRQLKSIEK